MLSRLKVLNLAVVEEAEAVFAGGLNVLTGETGAGKSVLMGALELSTGSRADSSVVRDGAAEARVEASFAIDQSSPVHGMLSDAGLTPCEDGELLIRRTVSAAGGGKVWINDSLSTVATLRRIGAVLVDVHGPRSSQKLLEGSCQREMLDAFGAISRDAYSAEWAALVSIREKIASLEAADVSDDALDLLRYQVGELEAAGLSDDDETLEERHAAAAHAAEVVEGANAITDAIGGDSGAVEAISRLQPTFASLARHFPEAAEWGATAEEITTRLQDLSREIADAAAKLDAEPGLLSELDDRLGVVNRLRRKYLKGTDRSVASLLKVLEEKSAKLAEIESRSTVLEQLRSDESAAMVRVADAGAELSARRAAAAKALASAVTRELRDLGFRQAKFSVRVDPSEPDATGCDTIVYMFEPNPGEPARPLADIASSGEIARVMLALKGAAGGTGADTLVFDEIDANIGGETGGIVGEKMRTVAAGRQVIAITHLPQCAARADRHLVVSKAVSGGRTRTSVKAVEGAEREAEIVRMLGSGAASKAAARHAEELLSSASSGHRSRRAAPRA
jgi:DNA repair protein RecN (Recombination protein N)